MHRDQHATDALDRGGRQVRLDAGERLQDLRGVPVPHRLVGAHDAGANGMVARRGRRMARRRGAHLGLDHHLAPRQEPAADERQQRQHGGGGDAAGAGEARRARQPRPAWGGAVELRVRVDERGEEFRARVRRPVPARVGLRVTQSEVGRQVDQDTGPREQVVDPSHELAVRQGRHDDVGGPQVRQRVEAQPGHAAEVRVDEGNGLARVPLAGDLDDVEAGVPQRQAQELTAGEAAAADDRNGSHGVAHALSLPRARGAPPTAAAPRPRRRPAGRRPLPAARHVPHPRA